MDDYVVVETNAEFRKLMETIFTDDFMRANTRFESFEGFRYSSAVMTNWKADRMIYSRTVFDHFVQESTDFSSWDEMVKTAADQRFSVEKSGGSQ